MGKEYVFELLKNNTFSLQLLNETLWDIKTISYSNLYRAQLVLSGIERVDIDLSTYMKQTSGKYTINAKTEFISRRHRKTFRESRFYKKDISIRDINSNPNIFSKSPMVFINGELYSNIYIRANEDITSFIFRIYNGFPTTPGYVRDGFTKQEFLNLISAGGKMTVFFIPVAFQQNRRDLNLPTIKNHTFNPAFLGLQVSGGFQPVNNMSHDDKFLAFMTSDDDRLYKYRLLNTTYNNDNIYFNGDQINTFTNVRTHLKLQYFLNNLQRVDVAGADKYFELPIQDMPVPVENMIIFRKKDNNFYFDHETKIKIHYPNIYEVMKTHTDDVMIMTYYYDDARAIGSKYSNELKLYYRFTQNILSKYKDMSIPDIIKNYQPIEVNYDIPDYEISSEHPDHLLYKLNRFKQLCARNGEFYAKYLAKLVGDNNGYYVYVNNIDLSTRIRHDNHTEIKTTVDQVTFDKPHYVFIFRHDSNKEQMDLFLDNYHINPPKWSDDKYTYVYIPVDKVKPNSIIEIEKLYDVEYRERFQFTNASDYIKLTIPQRYRIAVNDLFISHRIGTDEKYVPEADYDVYIKIDGEMIKTEKTSFYPYPEIYLKFINPAPYLNGELYINANRINFVHSLVNNSKDLIPIVLNNDTRNFQIFYNGRLLPNGGYVITFSDKIDGPHEVKGRVAVGATDRMDVVYTQNKRIPIYIQPSIDPHGYVDLTGKLDKPIDLRWYDIYLNGLKLNITNIDQLTPYKMIIKGIPTLTNLAIYQKNLDLDPFGIISNDISDEIINVIPGFKDDIITKYPIITDEIPDINEEIAFDVIGFIDEFLYTFGLINPDLEQITDEMILKYPFLFDLNDNLFVNPDMVISMADNVILIPDTQF